MNDPHRPLKTALGRFGTGVTVASVFRDDGEISAITVNSFASVSLDPPLVLWCLDKNASTYDHFAAAAHYGVSILRADQEDVSNRFAQRAVAPAPKPLFEHHAGGAPLLTDRLAGFDCAVTDRHDAGDHIILVAKVFRFDHNSGAPLMYFASQYHHGPAPAPTDELPSK